ncbi:hypothetical protein VTH06DRAFT_5353 [Thermothelomyces fergusii]
MSYEMSNPQNMTYPYPPPPAAVTISQPKSRFSKWWPLSFFIAAILLIIIGGALVGVWTANYSCTYSSCDDHTGLLWGAVACFVIGGLLKFVAWILLIVWCVKRTTRVPTSVAYSYQPLAYPPPAPAPAPLYNQQGAQPYQTAPPYQTAGAHSPAPQQKDVPQY